MLYLTLSSRCIEFYLSGYMGCLVMIVIYVNSRVLQLLSHSVRASNVAAAV